MMASFLLALPSFRGMTPPLMGVAPSLREVTPSLRGVTLRSVEWRRHSTEGWHDSDKRSRPSE